MSGTTIDHHKASPFVPPRSLHGERTVGDALSEFGQAHRGLGMLILHGALAGIFFATGTAKLAGMPAMADLFAQVGMGQWPRIVVGIVEIMGAIALLIPGLATVGALTLGCTMVGAVAVHLIVLHTNPAIATSLGLLNVVVVDCHRDQLRALLTRFRR